MIAIARPAVRSDVAASSQDRFLAILPQIRSKAAFKFRGTSPRVREELIAEVVANAFQAYVRLVLKGREALIYATPLAEYAIRQVRAGRRVGQPLNSLDLMAPGATKFVDRLDYFDSARGQWREALVEDKKAGPAETAAARIDFATWLRRLPRRDRQIAKTLALGESTKSAAKLFGISPARISQLRRELKESWERLQGEMVIAQ